MNKEPSLNLKVFVAFIIGILIGYGLGMMMTSASFGYVANKVQIENVIIDLNETQIVQATYELMNEKYGVEAKK